MGRFRDRPWKGLGLALWIVALVIFFPLFGWGVLGLSVGPQVLVAALVPHVLFALVLWGLTRWLYQNNI